MTKKPKTDPLVELAKQYTYEESRRAFMSATLKKQEDITKALKAELVEKLTQAGSNSTGFDAIRYWIETESEPQIENVQDLYAHIQKTGEFELLYRRINPKSVKERWEQGKKVPGVAAFPVTKLHSTGVKSYVPSQQDANNS